MEKAHVKCLERERPAKTEKRQQLVQLLERDVCFLKSQSSKVFKARDDAVCAAEEQLRQARTFQLGMVSLPVEL